MPRQATNQEKSQFKDDFSWTSAHGRSPPRLQGRGELCPRADPFGDFTVGTSGEFHLLTNDPNSPVTDIFVNGGFSGQTTPIDQYGIYLQDDWGFTNSLTLNLGVRYDYWDGFDLNQGDSLLGQILKYQRKYNEAYLKEFQGASDTLSNDSNNIAPRLGFTWDLSGNSTKVVRGGIGRFYDFPYTNATILFPASSVQSVYGTVYERHVASGIRNADGSFFQPGQTLPPGNEAPPLSAPLAGVASPSITNVPYSDQISAGYSWELSNNVGLNVDLVGVWYKDIPFRFRANPSSGCQRTATSRCIRKSSGAPLRGIRSQQQLPDLARRRESELRRAEHRRPRPRSEQASASGFLHVVQGGRERSRRRGRVPSDGSRTSRRNMHRLARDSSVNPLDPWCNACTGPLFSDARHRVTLSAVYDAPFGITGLRDRPLPVRSALHRARRK